MCKKYGKAPEKEYSGSFSVRVEPDLTLWARFFDVYIEVVPNGYYNICGG